MGSNNQRVSYVLVILALLNPLVILDDLFAAPTYRMVMLPTLGGDTSEPRGISNAGHVVGWSRTATGQQRGFLWHDSVIKELGTFGGAESIANDVNSQGEVVGDARGDDGFWHAFYYKDGVMEEIGTPAVPFGRSDVVSRANAINERGFVTGHSWGTTRFPWTVLNMYGWSKDVEIFDLGAWFSTGGLSFNGSTGWDVNNHGWVVGAYLDGLHTPITAVTFNRNSHLDPSSSRGIVLAQNFINPWVIVEGVNDHLQFIAGWNFDYGQLFHPFDTPATDLDALGMPAVRAINNLGQIVGHDGIIRFSNPTGKLYDNGTVVALDDITRDRNGWQIDETIDINDAQWIVAIARQGRRNPARTVLLIPDPEPNVLRNGDFDDDAEYGRALGWETSAAIDIGRLGFLPGSLQVDTIDLDSSEESKNFALQLTSDPELDDPSAEDTTAWVSQFVDFAAEPTALVFDAWFAEGEDPLQIEVDGMLVTELSSESGDIGFQQYQIPIPTDYLGKTDLRLRIVADSETRSRILLDNIELLTTNLPGDFDVDDDIDGADFLAWQRGESPDPLSQSDLAVWAANFGSAAPPLATSTGVPEPSTSLLVLSASFFLLQHRNHWRNP